MKRGPTTHLSASYRNRRSSTGELQMRKAQLVLAPIIRCILRPHHALLRTEVARAAGLIGRVVVEQRSPLCHTLLPLHRLFEEFRRDLDDHLDRQEALFPSLLDLELALWGGEEPVTAEEDVSEVLRLLRYGQIAITGALDEMRELTDNFIAPPDACKCYGELLDLLAQIQMEVASEVRMEGTMFFPQAAELLERALQSGAGSHPIAARTARGLQVV